MIWELRSHMPQGVAKIKKNFLKKQFGVLGLSIFRGSGNGKERAKETEKLWPETEEENPGSVVSWKQIQKAFHGGENN